MVVVLIIGILMAIAIPVFTSAQARAAQRACLASITTMERSWAQYAADQEGAVADPTDYDGVVAVLVPTYVKQAPVCKADGEYSVTSESPYTAINITCSVHGTPSAPVMP